jgi:MazG family protein
MKNNIKTFPESQEHPMDRLKSIMATLRGVNGCPWDKEQNYKSLIPCLLEESYEVVDAIETDDMIGLKEELGDLLFQSVFHARLAEEDGHFSIEDVINGISDKLIRRHPHVFANQEGIESAEQVVTQWEDIKSKEKLSKSQGKSENDPNPSVLDSVPVALPAIQKAEKIQSKVAKVGFDWEKWQEPIEKLWEEISELKVELDGIQGQLDVTILNSDKKIKVKDHIKEDLKLRIQNEMGDVLFSIINVARHLGLDAETALRKTNDKFSKRFRYIEKASFANGKNLKEMNLAEMDELWNQAKKLEY